MTDKKETGIPLVHVATALAYIGREANRILEKVANAAEAGEKPDDFASEEIVVDFQKMMHTATEKFCSQDDSKAAVSKLTKGLLEQVLAKILKP